MSLPESDGQADGTLGCRWSFDSSTAEIIRIADWDTLKTSRFANKAIDYLLNYENEKLPKETMVAFEIQE